MPYKPNRLRTKREAIQKKRSDLGKLGNVIKRQRMAEYGADLEVVGGFNTFGNMGIHRVELLACDDENHVWIRVDGELRKPRTMRGVYRILSEWIYDKRTMHPENLRKPARADRHNGGR